MKIKRSLLAAGTAAILGLSGLSAAQAHVVWNQDSLVDRLVSRFNLNREEVVDVLNEESQARQTEHQQVMRDRLDQAVADGQLTQEQASQVKAKQEEMQSFMDSLQNMDPAERRAAMQSQMDEMYQWAEDNNIPLQYFGPDGFGHHSYGGNMMYRDHTPARNFAN